MGAVLLFSCVSAFLSLAFGTLEIAGKEFRAGGYVGDGLAADWPTYLNRTGSIILILTLLFLSIILSTQFSFGRLFGFVGGLRRIGGSRRSARCARRREEHRREHQRQEVLKKHFEKSGRTRLTPGISKKAATQRKPRTADHPADCQSPGVRRRRPCLFAAQSAGAEEEEPRNRHAAAMVGAAAAALKAASSKPTPPPPIRRPLPTPQIRRCRCLSPTSCRQSARRRVHACRHSRCSMRRTASARSTSAS